jgi:imidazolonepropionase-like amidohydrolase
MRNTPILTALILFALQSLSQTSPIAISHVSIVDVKTGKIADEMTVFIIGNRIDQIGKTNKTAIPKNAQEINGSGKFLIPGLWDMHVHTFQERRPDYFFQLFVGNGITGIRDMGGSFPLETMTKIRDSIIRGQKIGPRIGAMAGRILDGPGVTANVAVSVHDTAEAREYVRHFKRQGADFIKVYNLLSREVYLAIIEEAKKQNIPVAGHVPFAMKVAEVSDLGQVCIEHTAAAASLPAELFISCSTDENQLRTQLENDRAAGQETRVIIEDMAVKSYDEKKAKDLFLKFAKNGTWQCPTMVLNYPFLVGDTLKLAADERLKFIPSSMIERWNATFRQRRVNPNQVSGNTANPNNPQVRRLRLERRFALLLAMHKEGVKFLAGTDVANPYTFPGFSIHDELENFVQAGFTNLESLQTATLNPAIFLHAEDSLGSIGKGKIADAVLLDANPLENISNTKRIFGVLLNGKYFSKAQLDQLFLDAEKIAKDNNK